MPNLPALVKRLGVMSHTFKNRKLPENYYLPAICKHKTRPSPADYNHRRYHESIVNSAA